MLFKGGIISAINLFINGLVYGLKSSPIGYFTSSLKVIVCIFGVIRVRYSET